MDFGLRRNDEKTRKQVYCVFLAQVTTKKKN
jgi:hypothetical protein